MTDTHNDMPQNAQQPRAHTEQSAGQPTAGTIQVLVLSPDEVPRLQTIENRPNALEALVGGPFITFPMGIGGTIGVSSADGANPNPTLDRATDAMGMAISVTFVVAGDAGDGTSLQSISPLHLERALERFAPTLPLAQFEKIMLSHPLGPEWIANWEPSEL